MKQRKLHTIKCPGYIINELLIIFGKIFEERSTSGEEVNMDTNFTSSAKDKLTDIFG